MDNATSYVKTFALNLKPMYDQSSFKQVIAKVKDGFEKIETLPVKFDDEKIAKDLKEAVEKARSEVNDSTLQLIDASTTLTDEQKQAAYEAYDKQTEALFKIKKLKDEIAAQEMFGNEDSEILNELKKQLEDIKEEAEKLGLKEDDNGDYQRRSPKDKDEDQANDDEEEQRDFASGWKDAKQSWAAEHTAAVYGKKAFDKMADSIEKFKDKALETLKKFAEEALEELEEMASWDVFGSTKYNKDASEMYMSYGLQGADAYAMNKALEATGIDDIETYLTDPMVRSNQALLDAFNEQYEIAKKQYKEDLEIAKSYQEFQKEFDVFKRELKKSLIDFFMDNKDTIMTILKFLMKSMQLIVDLVGDIVSFFGGNTVKDRNDEQRQSDMNELLGVTNNSTISYDNRSNNVNVNNTYNGVGKVDQGMLQNVGQMTYQQIIEYLGRE